LRQPGIGLGFPRIFPEKSRRLRPSLLDHFDRRRGRRSGRRRLPGLERRRADHMLGLEQSGNRELVMLVLIQLAMLLGAELTVTG
jgi:hypothetical protein